MSAWCGWQAFGRWKAAPGSNRPDPCPWVFSSLQLYDRDLRIFLRSERQMRMPVLRKEWSIDNDQARLVCFKPGNSSLPFWAETTSNPSSANQMQRRISACRPSIEQERGFFHCCKNKSTSKLQWVGIAAANHYTLNLNKRSFVKAIEICKVSADLNYNSK